MELRYVYRRIEDDIGSSLGPIDSPQSAILRRLRYDFREQSDLVATMRMNINAISSLSGNERIDVMKSYEKIRDMIKDAFYRVFPYEKRNEEAAHASKMDRLKALLDQLNEQGKDEINGKDDMKNGSDKTEGKTGTSNSDII